MCSPQTEVRLCRAQKPVNLREPYEDYPEKLLPVQDFSFPNFSKIGENP